MMQFICSSSDNGVEALSNELKFALAKYDKVLWLVPGGSNIPFAVEVMGSIPEELSAKLTITLTDERYGPLNHPDSNARQLHEGFDPKLANFIPVLEDNLSLEDTVSRFAEIAAQEFKATEFVLAQFGIGADGHIAGILPHSPAASSDSLAAGYKTADFTRITLTFKALKRINVAYAFVYGEPKRATLQNLKTKNLELEVQPSQILKVIPKSFVYNDQVE